MSRPHALIIGGTRGVGRAIARLLVEHGQVVTIVGRREPAAGDRDWAGVKHVLADVSDKTSTAAMLEQVKAGHGLVNYVVFCQRYRGQGDDWQGELDVVLTLTKNVIEGLGETGWAEGDRGMVVVSAVGGEWVCQGQPVSYAVSKAGIMHMMRYYAVNLGKRGIRANTVTPFTYLKEESASFYTQNAPLMELYREMVPLGRLATSDDVARVVRFLCSPDAAYLTGQNLHVDGGLSAVWPEQLARRLTKI